MKIKDKSSHRLDERLQASGRRGVRDAYFQHTQVRSINFLAGRRRTYVPNTPIVDGSIINNKIKHDPRDPGGRANWQREVGWVGGGG